MADFGNPLNMLKKIQGGGGGGGGEGGGDKKLSTVE